MENVTEFQITFQRYLFTPIYSLVLFFGLIGNLGALYYFIFKIKQKSPSNIYIINLAVADTVFLFALPFRIHYHLNDSNWIFGDPMCRITGTIFFANIYISISFMTCICVDRYIATVHPHTYLRLRNTSLTALVSTAVWLVSGSAVLAFMLTCPLSSKENKCFEGFNKEEWSDLAPYSIASLIFGSLLPSAVILVCYPIVACRIAGINNSTARGARRIIYAILAITLLCFLPYHFMHLVYLLSRLRDNTENDENDRMIYYLRRVTMALVSLNSLLDPLLYYFATGHYKWRLKRLRLKKKKGVYSISNGF